MSDEKKLNSQTKSGADNEGKNLDLGLNFDKEEADSHSNAETNMKVDLTKISSEESPELSSDGKADTEEGNLLVKDALVAKEAGISVNREISPSGNNDVKSVVCDKNGIASHDPSTQLDESVLSSDEVVTLGEILEDQNRLEEEAEALLGGERGNVCTYPEGYKPRQPLYACLDCRKEGCLAGICYGCSLHCHDGHELIELYSKRNFCCDCGNSKFKVPCKLYEEKKPLNDRNEYNQNFNGLYCTCSQPYTGENDMFQCCVCEDWFHAEHLGEGPAPSNVYDAQEIVCSKCVERLPFLRVYADNHYREETVADGECLLKKLSDPPPKSAREAICFDSDRWRERLCKCRSCLNLYEDKNVVYITDSADCVGEFVSNNRKVAAEPTLVDADEDDKADRMIVETVGRETAITLFAGYDRMKRKLIDVMQTAASEGRVVSAEDINAAFDELKSDRKRIRLTESLPSSCGASHRSAKQ